MFRTYLTYFLAYTDNTDLAILLNKDTFEPDPFITLIQGRLYEQEYLGHGTAHCPCHAPSSFDFWFTYSHILFCTYPQRRGQET